ncbi:MAG: tRNA lysidine(34) synthetase TilS [Candidatus Coproplasma sp.]
MNIDLSPYKNKKICVAVSGGRDSMALLHYFLVHAEECEITLSALNCDHAIRGEESERDSAFVREYCAANGVLCHSFKWEGERFSDEGLARSWRLCCYNKIITEGKADLIATAHHMNDNAETVLFNLARGASLSGVTGIADSRALGLIRPLIGITREGIDGYIKENDVPFVEDSTNHSDDYTRNKIRHNVLPALEEAVPGAVKNIFRFSRLAAEDEEYFSRQVNKILVKRADGGYLIKSCTEPVIFKRALRRILTEYGKKDFTSAQMRTVYEMQWLNSGKRFSFLGLVAIKEEGGVALCCQLEERVADEGMPFYGNLNSDQQTSCRGVLACADYEENLEDALACLCDEVKKSVKVLKFDVDKIPETAVIRFKKSGDKFTKFGGGTKSLGDYLTNKKVPQSRRERLPLVCDKDEVLIVGGVEISDKIKITEKTDRVGIFICLDPFKDD